MKMLRLSLIVASAVFFSTPILEGNWGKCSAADVLRSQVQCRNCSRDRQLLEGASKTEVRKILGVPQSTHDTEDWLYRGLWYDEYSAKYYNVCRVQFKLVKDEYQSSQYEVAYVGFSSYFGR